MWIERKDTILWCYVRHDWSHVEVFKSRDPNHWED